MVKVCGFIYISLLLQWNNCLKLLAVFTLKYIKTTFKTNELKIHWAWPYSSDRNKFCMFHCWIRERMDCLCQFTGATPVHLGGRAIKTPEALTSVLFYHLIFKCDSSWKKYCFRKICDTTDLLPFFPLSSLVNLIKCMFHSSLNCGVGWKCT